MKTIAIGFGGVLLGILIGFAYGRLSSSSTETRPQNDAVTSIGAAPATSGSSGVRDELAAIRDQLDRLVTRSSERREAIPHDVPTVDPNLAIERLIALLSENSRSEEAEAFVRSRVGEPGLVARLRRECAPFVEPMPDAYYEWRDRVCESITAQHVLWTVDDVLRAYGPPDKISERAGDWLLEYALQAGGKDAVTLAFAFVGARVNWAGVGG